MKTFFLRSWTLTLLGQLAVCITLPQAYALPETWTITGAMSCERTNHTATLLSNGKVLVAGGSTTNGSGIFYSSAELYDPVTESWTSTGSMSVTRGWHTATLLGNGKVLVAGGFDTGGNRIASAEVYDPATGAWTNTGSMSTACYGHRATLLGNGKVLVAGGGGQQLPRQSRTL